MAKITDAQFAEQIKDYSEEQKAMLLNVREQVKGLELAMNAEFKTAEQVEADLTALKSQYATNEAFKELQGQLIETATKVANMKNKNLESAMSFNEQISKAIAENATEIKDAFKNNRVHEIATKVVGTVTTGSATIQGSTPTYNQANPANANLRELNVLPLCTSFSTNQASFPYTETLPKDGDYTFQTEGSDKAQIDFKVETRYAAPKTLAAWIKLTEQSVDDIPFLQSVATDLLFKKHNLKKNKALIADSITVASSFSAGALAGTVVNPNVMDAINACVTKIYTTTNFTDEMPYMANVALMNPIDFFVQFVSAKDGEGRALYPTASLFNQVVIGGVLIIPEQSIPVGNVLVADMSRMNVSNYKPYTVKIGYVNDDFIKNQFVILGESRYHSFVKQLDRIAFIYDTIANIKTAIAD
jgi:hypothetical protein